MIHSKPDLVSLLTTKLSTKAKIDEWQRQVNLMDWTCNDGCCLDHEDSAALDALTLAHSLDLSLLSVMRRTRGEEITLAAIIASHASKCPHYAGVDEQVKQLAYIATEKVGIRTDGRPSRDKLDLPALYYDRQSLRFWHEANDGCWQSVTDKKSLSLLNQAGLSNKRGDDGSLSEAETYQLERIKQHGVDWAGPLAGWKAGHYEMSGHKILVTHSFKLIEPVPGDYSTALAFVEGLLGDEQAMSLLATQKLFYEALRDQTDLSGPMTILCGPPDCGKSLLQDWIITPVWGGRAENAARVLTGKSEFNADACKAEHLYLDDTKPYGNWLSRHDFSETLKGFIVGKGISVHAKGRDGITLRARQRVTMSLNDDETALRSLPDFSSSFKGKAHLFRCRKFDMPMPNDTLAERAAFEAQIRSELPAYIDMLLKLKIPTELHDQRFLIKCHLDPELLAIAEEMSDEVQLDSLVDRALTIKEDQDAWTGTADDLKWTLMKSNTYGPQATKLLGWANAAGTLLGRLAQKKPEKYEACKDARLTGKRTRYWRIHLAE